MATLIKTDGSEQKLSPLGGKFTLTEWYAAVGNGCDMVQAVELADGSTLICDEEAKVRPPQGTSRVVNEKATRLLAEAGGIPGDRVLGNVLILERSEK
jgi:hypothetical protein